MTGGAASTLLPLCPPVETAVGCGCDLRGVRAVEEATAALRGFLRAERDLIDRKPSGDLVEGLVPVAAALVCMVRGDGDVEAIRWLLRGLSQREVEALPIVVAAMVDPGTSVREAFGWITWDEDGRRLEREPSMTGTVRNMADLYLANRVKPSGVTEALAAADCAEARGMYLRGDDVVRIATVYGVSEKRVSRWVKGGAP